jgi:hypothetical protein
LLKGEHVADRNIQVVFYRQNHVRPDWQVDIHSYKFDLFFIELADDLARFGIGVSRSDNEAVTIDINSYADLLNAVRISSPADGFTNICIGHVIGKSPNLDLFEDIKRAVNRVAFAPDMIPPDDQNRKVCHNCGCGC